MIKNPQGTLEPNKRIYTNKQEFLAYLKACETSLTKQKKANKTVYLKIGDLVFGFKSTNLAFLAHFKKRFKPFTTTTKSKLVFTVHILNKVGPDSKTKNQKINTFLSKNEMFYLTSKALLLWSKQKQLISLQKGFKCFQMVLTAILYKLLLDNNGVLIHSSCIAQKRAYLFFGLSGSGKSTIADLALKTHTILNDDLSVVRLVGSKVLAYANPLWGTFFRTKHPNYQATNKKYPLTKLVRPIKSTKNYLQAMTKPLAFANLVASTGWKSDPYYTQKTSNTLAKIISKTGCSYLYFKKDPSFLKELND